MEPVSVILREKGSEVKTILATNTISEAAAAIEKEKVGALLVIKDGKIAGILSERDIVTRVVSKEIDPKAAKVKDYMTKDVVVITVSTPIKEAMAIMTHQKCRHLPVLDEDKLAGLISIGDMNRHISKDNDFTIRFMTEYIQGKYMD